MQRIRKNLDLIAFFFVALTLSFYLTRRGGPSIEVGLWEYGGLSLLMRLAAGNLEIGGSVRSLLFNGWLPSDLQSFPPVLAFLGVATKLFGQDLVLRIAPLVFQNIAVSLSGFIIYFLCTRQLGTSRFIAAISGITQVSLPALLSLGVAQSILPFSLSAAVWISFLTYLKSGRVGGRLNEQAYAVLGAGFAVSLSGPRMLLIWALIAIATVEGRREIGKVVLALLLAFAICFCGVFFQPALFASVLSGSGFPQSEIEQIRLTQFLTPLGSLGYPKLDALLDMLRSSPASAHYSHSRFLGPIPFLGMAAGVLTILGIGYKATDNQFQARLYRGLGLAVVLVFLFGTVAGFSSLLQLVGFSQVPSSLGITQTLATLGILLFGGISTQILRAVNPSGKALVFWFFVLLIFAFGQLLAVKLDLHPIGINQRRIVWQSAPYRRELAAKLSSTGKNSVFCAFDAPDLEKASARKAPLWTARLWGDGDGDSGRLRALVNALLIATETPDGTRIEIEPRMCASQALGPGETLWPGEMNWSPEFKQVAVARAKEPK